MYGNKTEITWKKKLIGFFLLIILIVFGIFLINLIWKTLISLPKEISTPIIAASATILISVFSVIISKRLERKREVEQEILKQKIMVYEEFMSFWIKDILLHHDKIDEDSKIKASKLFFANFTPKLIVWGSDHFIKEYLKFKHIFESIDSQTREAIGVNLLFLENLLFIIRSDIGHKNKGLVSYDLLSLFLKDVPKKI